MWLQMALFHSFLWLSNIPLYICTTSSSSIPLSMNIYFRILAIVNSVAMNIAALHSLFTQLQEPLVC